MGILGLRNQDFAPPIADVLPVGLHQGNALPLLPNRLQAEGPQQIGPIPSRCTLPLVRQADDEEFLRQNTLLLAGEKNCELPNVAASSIRRYEIPSIQT